MNSSVLDACLAVQQSVPSFPSSVSAHRLLRSSSFEWSARDESFLEQRVPKFPPASSQTPVASPQMMEREKTIGILENMRKRFNQIKQQEKEAKWLPDNRTQYAGLWVALEGDELLASGPSAREIFAQVAHRSSPPLVMQVESAPLPFSGW